MSSLKMFQEVKEAHNSRLKVPETLNKISGFYSKFLRVQQSRALIPFQKLQKGCRIS